MKSNESQIKTLIENWAKAVRDKDIDATLAHHSVPSEWALTPGSLPLGVSIEDLV